MAVSAPVRNLICVLLGGLLAGCSPDIPADFATYQTRLNHLLEQPDPPPPTVPVIPLPAQRHLQRPLPDLRIGLLDILPLNQCGLGALIAERNGSLGRSGDHVNQLAYEWQLVQGLQRCRLADPEQARWLQELARQKSDMLPDRFWNLLVSTTELRRTFNPRHQPLPLDRSVQASRLALEQLHQWQLAVNNPSHPPESLPSLALILEPLYRSDALPRLLYSLSLAAAWLNQISAQLEDMPASRLCPTTDPQRLGRLRGAMTHYYGKSLQPWLAHLERQYRLIESPLAALFADDYSPALAPWRLTYAARLDSLVWQDFRAATLRHAHAWQAVFSRCNQAPAVIFAPPVPEDVSL
ncbi:DUF3080 family protein [Aeromonas australiensis]|uniref:DUF3080 family protein n=1 Tax=Aeromonas australiensis TaxID=1114880 RepID=UPI0009E43D33|nr:DUF3080 family protein [Aeromonas australiensis]